MKNVAIVMNRAGKQLETKSFNSYAAVERYVASKYDSGIYDWVIEQGIEQRKPNKKDIEKANKLGVNPIAFIEAKKHFIKIY